MAKFTEKADFLGGANFSGNVTLPTEVLSRSNFATNRGDVFIIPMDEGWRVHDAPGTALPNTAASDDLGLVVGPFGTVTPTLQTSDAKATTITQYARRVI